MLKIKLFFPECLIFPPLLLYFILTDSKPVQGYDYKEDTMAPIILVPGIASSQIVGKWHTHNHPKHCDKKGNWQHMWLNPEMAIMDPGSLKCWIEEQGYVDLMTELVEEVAADTKRKVAIVAHSLGGLVIAYFLQKKTQEWKDKHIHAFITSGTPWLGSPFALENYIVGDTYGVETIRKSTMRNLFRTFQSTAFLLPEEEEYKNIVLLETQQRNYTAKDYKSLFKDMGLTNVYLMRRDLRRLFPVPIDQLGVRYICVWSNSSKIETAETFRADAATMKDTDKVDVVVNTEGDTSVPIKSLRYCEQFENVTAQSFQGYTHREIITKGVFHDYVMSVVSHAQAYSG